VARRHHRGGVAVLPDTPAFTRDTRRLADGLRSLVEMYAYYEPDPAMLALFARLYARLRAAGIEVILFVPPLTVCDLEVLQQAGAWPLYEQWKRDLAAVAPYWDFAGPDAIAAVDPLFEDVGHFTSPVGHTMMRRALGLDCTGCGPVASVCTPPGASSTPRPSTRTSRSGGGPGSAAMQGSYCRPFVAPVLQAVTQPRSAVGEPAG